MYIGRDHSLHEFEVKVRVTSVDLTSIEGRYGLTYARYIDDIVELYVGVRNSVSVFPGTFIAVTSLDSNVRITICQIIGAYCIPTTTDCILTVYTLCSVIL